MKTAITIHRLCEKPEWAAQCQAWDEAEWPRTPEIEEFFSNHYIEASQNKDGVLPQTFLALRDNKLIGMLSLIAEDHPDFLHLSPWIASVYCIPQERYSRAAYMLLQAAVKYVRGELKLKNIYTYTHLNAAIKGWEFLQAINDPFDPQEQVGLYRYDVTQSMDATSGK